MSSRTVLLFGLGALLALGLIAYSRRNTVTASLDPAKQPGYWADVL